MPLLIVREWILLRFIQNSQQGSRNEDLLIASPQSAIESTQAVDAQLSRDTPS